LAVRETVYQENDTAKVLLLFCGHPSLPSINTRNYKHKFHLADCIHIC